MGIEAQEKRLRQYAEEHGYSNIEIYIDNGYGGVNFDRPAFQKMMNAISNGEIRCVIIKDICRISRSYLHFGKWFDDMRGINVRVVAINDSLDSGNYYIQDVSLVEVIEKYYRDAHSKRIKAGIAHARMRKLEQSANQAK